MIVNYSEIKHMDDEEIQEIRNMCVDNSEMFCLCFTNDDFRMDSSFTLEELREVNSISLSMKADIIIMNDKNTGKITEMKNRYYNYGTLELREVPVLTFNTKTVCVRR